jgi:DNA-directed RNA polymerase specialized sigma24 family protein
MSPAAASRASADATCTADQALIRLYTEHFRALLCLAALLVQDLAAAEEITEAAFAATHDAFRGRVDTGAAVAFLRRGVVSRARVLQRRQPDAVPGLTRGPLMAGLRSLPERQREAVVLRYYSGLSEAQAADAMGVSRSAVKRHTARGASALRTILGQESACA